ncbi:hypothetical protein ANCCAN_26844 [Ancylostoma caninum]|uniref:Uncharacterized protein n=1 Tax=Ancylostoma caninum TaxID=29170 RepID=A0A368F5L6_ANCCA|nr:hypothetical protein ANCCAN_26844 [Ancylostoma caninum]
MKDFSLSCKFSRNSGTNLTKPLCRGVVTTRIGALHLATCQIMDQMSELLLSLEMLMPTIMTAIEAVNLAHYLVNFGISVIKVQQESTPHRTRFELNALGLSRTIFDLIS